ncbi:GntR family transcriptional regulator [Alcaligenaceae bacterium]|nr:GntR family transcriptional regulator [Alcaligenaceae bacterium]
MADGELLPGQKLTGRVLSEKLGVSQTPVREAMLQLVAERALTMNPNRSLTVPLLNRDKFIELRDLRIVLESMASRHAAIEADASVIKKLEELHKKMIKAKRSGDYQTTLRLNRLLHFSVYELCGKEELFAIIQSLWARTGPYLNFLYVSVDPTSFDGHPHEALIEGLRTHDADMAEEAVKRDILDGGKAILDAL